MRNVNLFSKLSEFPRISTLSVIIKTHTLALRSHPWESTAHVQRRRPPKGTQNSFSVLVGGSFKPSLPSPTMELHTQALSPVPTLCKTAETQGKKATLVHHTNHQLTFWVPGWHVLSCLCKITSALFSPGLSVPACRARRCEFSCRKHDSNISRVSFLLWCVLVKETYKLSVLRGILFLKSTESLLYSLS